MNLEQGYEILTGVDSMQLQRIHAWLSSQSYWAAGIPVETVQTTIEHSFCVGVFHNGLQIGFARFVTDYAVFAYLADVYVEEEHRGKGLSKEMMRTLMQQPWVKSLRRLMLATRDAHGLYEQFGFQPIEHPERMMEIIQPNVYSQQTHPLYEFPAKQYHPVPDL